MAATDDTNRSGKINLRPGPQLHAEAAQAAAAAGVSLNTWIINAMTRELGRLEREA